MWRPKGWRRPYNQSKSRSLGETIRLRKAYELGADTMLKALISEAGADMVVSEKFREIIGEIVKEAEDDRDSNANAKLLRAIYGTSLEDYKPSIESNLLGLIDDSLSPRQAAIIKIRYGFGFSGLDLLVESRSHSLREIGIMFHVTTERIRQIESQALRKMRHPNNRRRYIKEAEYETD